MLVLHKTFYMRSEHIQIYSPHKSAQAFHKAGMPDALSAPPSSQEPLENDTEKRILAEVLDGASKSGWNHFTKNVSNKLKNHLVLLLQQ